jgi:DNA-binding protein HU-beta
MTKAEIAKLVANKTGISKKMAAKTVDIFLDCIKDALKKREKVSIVGFGTFDTKVKRQRSGRNPRTRTSIIIPEKIVPFFKACKSLKNIK